MKSKSDLYLITYVIGNILFEAIKKGSFIATPNLKKLIDDFICYCKNKIITIRVLASVNKKKQIIKYLSWENLNI